MGRPKHLLRLGAGGRTWLENAAEAIRPHVRDLVLSGDIAFAGVRGRWPILPDAPGARGPMAGLLSAMAWRPGSSWLLAACDMPFLSGRAVRWLLAARRPGSWACIPVCGSGRVPQPLFAVYEGALRRRLESMAARGDYSLARLAGAPRVDCPPVPAELERAWTNVNSPAEMPDFSKPSEEWR